MVPTFYATAASAVVLLALAVLAWRAGRRRWQRWRRVLRATAVGLMVLLVLPAGGLTAYLGWRLWAGQTIDVPDIPLPRGGFRHVALTTPGLAVVHVFEMSEPAKSRFVVSPPTATPAGPRAIATTATDAASALDADVLVNANFFTPFHDNWFLDYAPHADDPVEPIGPVVADGVAYGRAKAGWPSFWQMPDGTVGLGDLPTDARDAVTVRQWLLRGGAVAVRQDEPPYPRTAVAVNADCSRLWLVVVDGKQPRYSDGLTLGDLATYLATLGATDAIELDGGGSSTLVYTRNDKPLLMSRPCHTKIPARQRPCGIFLGVRLDGRH